MTSAQGAKPHHPIGPDAGGDGRVGAGSEGGEGGHGAPRRAEALLAAMFRDRQSRRLGTGWAAGILAIALGLVVNAAVLCLHFPQYLTLPQLRGLYPLPLIRSIIDLAILLVLALAALSLVLRRRETLGLAALALAALALLLGGGGVPIERVGASALYLGLDWFVLGLLSTAALFVPLELWRPLRAGQGPFRPGWLTDAEYFFASHALVQALSVLAVLPALRLGEWLTIPALAAAIRTLPLAVQMLACLVIADLAQYWVHRAFHRIPVLWRFHLVHHSVAHMDWLAGSRLHFVDIVLTRGMVLLPLVALGFDERAVIAYLAFVAFHAVFIHANFAPSPRWLESWLVLPRYHHWHHAREAEAHDRNFAVHLPVLDRLFGTHHLPPRAWPQGYGAAGETPPHGWLRQLVWPLRRRG